MKIKISEDITNILTDFHIIAYTMDVSNNETTEVKDLLNNLSLDIDILDICNNPVIKETRDGYKALGKDPSHTRPACEALARRVIKKQGIYSLGDLIDLGNILSVKTLRSVCVTDLDKINGDVLISIGKSGEVVKAIHRDDINAENLIVYIDDEGIFGSPTSDTLRTAVSNTTNKILVMIICFSKSDKDKSDEAMLIELYKKYANAENIKRILL